MDQPQLATGTLPSTEEKYTGGYVWFSKGYTNPLHHFKNHGAL